MQMSDVYLCDSKQQTLNSRSTYSRGAAEGLLPISPHDDGTPPRAKVDLHHEEAEL